MRLSLPGLAIVLCCSTLSATAQETASIALTNTVVPAVRSTASAAVRPVDSTASTGGAAAKVLKTRCLDTGLLRLGASCVFRVVEPMKLGDQAFAVGDLIYAHVDQVKGVAGRVYMRTDRVVCAKTQQATPLSMVATEQPRQPGVDIPHLLDGWTLNWEPF